MRLMRVHDRKANDLLSLTVRREPRLTCACQCAQHGSRTCTNHAALHNTPLFAHSHWQLLGLDG